MDALVRVRASIGWVLFTLVAGSALAQAQPAAPAFEPSVGQQG